MADSLRVTTRQQAPSGSGTTNHTISGFGTPTAALVFCQIGGVDADADHHGLSVGFWDGTNYSCSCYMHEHNVAATNVEQSGTFNNVVAMIDLDTVGVRSATIANITDGVQLTWDAGTAFQPRVTVVLISANNAAAGIFQAAATDGGTVDVTGLGFTPNFVFTNAHYGTSFNSLSTSAGLSLGFASNESGGITRRCVMNRFQDASSVTNNASIVNSDRSSNNITGAAELTSFEVTAFASGQFTVTTRQEAGLQAAYHSYLALNLDDIPITFTANTPTAAGDWDPYTDTQQRQSTLFYVTANDALDGLDNVDSNGAGMGWYVVDSSGGEQGGYVVSEDNVATRNTSGRMSDKMIIQGETAGAPIFDASNPTFDSTGLVFADADVNHDTTSRYMCGVAFGLGVEPTGEFIAVQPQRNVRHSGRYL